MMRFENLSSIELNKTAGMILGTKPCRYGERMVQMTMDQGYLTLVIDKSHTFRKGGREITETVRRVEVWAWDGQGIWTKITEARGEKATESVLSFYVPDQRYYRDKAAWARLGGILTQDGYTIKAS